VDLSNLRPDGTVGGPELDEGSAETATLEGESVEGESFEDVSVEDVSAEDGAQTAGDEQTEADAATSPATEGSRA
jgi:hypothetical protein